MIIKRKYLLIVLAIVCLFLWLSCGRPDIIENEEEARAIAVEYGWPWLAKMVGVDPELFQGPILYSSEGPPYYYEWVFSDEDGKVSLFLWVFSDGYYDQGGITGDEDQLKRAQGRLNN